MITYQKAVFYLILFTCVYLNGVAFSLMMPWAINKMVGPGLKADFSSPAMIGALLTAVVWNTFWQLWRYSNKK